MPHASTCQYAQLQTAQPGLRRHSQLARRYINTGSLKKLPHSVHCNSATAASTSTAVQPGNTVYGRGLVSCQKLNSGTKLLSIPFAELLLLPDKVDGPYKTVHEHFWRAHGSLPDELLRFITG